MKIELTFTAAVLAITLLSLPDCGKGESDGRTIMVGVPSEERRSRADS